MRGIEDKGEQMKRSGKGWMKYCQRLYFWISREGKQLNAINSVRRQQQQKVEMFMSDFATSGSQFLY